MFSVTDPQHLKLNGLPFENSAQEQREYFFTPKSWNTAVEATSGTVKIMNNFKKINLWPIISRYEWQQHVAENLQAEMQ